MHSSTCPDSVPIVFAFSLVQQNPGSCSLEDCLQKALHGSFVKLLNIGIRGGIFLKLFTVDVLLHYLESMAKFSPISMIEDQTSGQQAL